MKGDGKILVFDPDAKHVKKARDVVFASTGLHVERIDGFGSFVSGSFNVILRDPPSPDGELVDVTIDTPAKLTQKPTWFLYLPLQVDIELPKPFSGDDAGDKWRRFLNAIRTLTTLDATGEANDATWLRELVASTYAGAFDVDDHAHGRGVTVGPLVYDCLVNKQPFVQGGTLYIFLDQLELQLTQVRQRVERSTLIALLRRVGFTRDDKRGRGKDRKSKTRSVYTIPLADLERDDDTEEGDD